MPIGKRVGKFAPNILIMRRNHHDASASVLSWRAGQCAAQQKRQPEDQEKEDEVNVGAVFPLADPGANLGAVHFRHHPVH